MSVPHETKNDMTSKIGTGSEAQIDVGEGDTVNLTWDPATERRLVRKLDLHILPILTLIFLLNILDRANMSNARLQGMQVDLGLTDVQYQTCISILLVGYVACQIPFNMFLNTLHKPRFYLCSCVVIWGAISALTSLTKGFGGAAACRIVLGIVEAAYTPGAYYYLSRWYTRREMQVRLTTMNAGNILANAFGGLIAAGVLSGMEGLRDIRSWRWLFIIEGLITVFVGLCAFFILPDWPGTTSWLSENERFIAQKRLADDIGVADVNDEEESIFAGLRAAVSDVKVWLLCAIYFFSFTAVSFSAFFPSVVQGLGYSTIKTLLLTAPPWIWVFVVALPNAWHADKTGERFFHYMWPAVVAMTGFLIAANTHVLAARYVSMFMMTTGFCAPFVLLSWISNTIPRSPAKRAVAIAMVVASGNIGGIAGSYFFPIAFAPYYAKSFYICFSLFGGGILAAFTLRTYLSHLNKKFDSKEFTAHKISNSMLREGAILQNESLEETEKRAKAFRYLY